MAQLYRKSALEKISSPEQLDKALKVSSPLSWLVLIGITLIIVVTVIWSIIGTIPVTVTATGYVVKPTGLNAVYASEAGTVDRIYVSKGQQVHLGTPVLSYHVAGDPTQRYIWSDQVGTVSSVSVSSGGSMTQGNEVVRVSPAVTGEQAVVAYVSAADARKIQRGAEVHVFLNGVDSQRYGYMVGRVYSVDSYITTNDALSEVLGSKNSVSGEVTKNGSVVAFVCELYPDASSGNSYYWSNEKGKTVTVDSGSASVKVVTEEVRPITKLFSKLKEIWGD